jgi:ribose transport system permease protein
MNDTPEPAAGPGPADALRVQGIAKRFGALTAVALAGVALTGGRGSLPRVLVGALILATIANGLTIRGIQPYWAIVATGALLLGSLMFERALQTAVSERLMSANLSVHAKQG